jgi:hypothetical protein
MTDTIIFVTILVITLFGTIYYLMNLNEESREKNADGENLYGRPAVVSALTCAVFFFIFLFFFIKRLIE